MNQCRLIRRIVAIAVLFSFVLQATLVSAGTTGTLNGVLLDAQSQKPIPGVTVTAASPTQTAKAITDGSGRFGFISLAPDTYTV